MRKNRRPSTPEQLVTAARAKAVDDLMDKQSEALERSEMDSFREAHALSVRAVDAWRKQSARERRAARSAAELADLRSPVRSTRDAANRDQLLDAATRRAPETVDTGGAPPLDPVGTLTAAPAAPPATLAA